MRLVLAGLVALGIGVSTAAAGDAERGQEIYEARCSFCHGIDGKGNGPAGAALQPQPTNFTDPAYWQRTRPDMIRLMIVNGKPGTAMVPFGQTLKGNEIEDVAAYLQTFR